MNRSILIPFLLLYASTLIYAQGGNEKFEFKFQLSPTLERMNPRNRVAKSELSWDRKLSYNFGIEYARYFAPDVSLATGVLIQNKGYRSILTNFTSSDPRFNNSVFVLSAKYVSVPTNLNIHLETGNKSRFLLTFGLMNGYLIDARSKYKRVSSEELSVIDDPFDNNDVIENTIIYNDVFNKWFLGLNLGFGITKYVKDKIAIEVHPLYTAQLNRGISKNARVTAGNFRINPKFDSLALDVKLGYYFNKQIKNSQKQF